MYNDVPVKLLYLRVPPIASFVPFFSESEYKKNIFF